MDNKEKSPEKELIESIGLMIEKGMESNTNIYTGVVKSVDGKRAVVAVNGQNQNVSIATADVSSGNVVRVFVPEGNMSAAFIIKAEASGGGGGTTTTAYGDLTGKPRINGVTLVDNKTSKELKLYGTDNAPPYPVTSVNGQTGDVTISAGGNVDSVNGKTGVVVLNKSDVGLGNVDNVRQYSTSNPPPYPVRSVDGATGAVVTNAVKTTPQSLSDTQKQQARTNIGAGTSSFDGDYNSLTNKPTIPTKTSQLTNDSGFISDIPPSEAHPICIINFGNSPCPIYYSQEFAIIRGSDRWDFANRDITCFAVDGHNRSVIRNIIRYATSCFYYAGWVIHALFHVPCSGCAWRFCQFSIHSHYFIVYA